MPLRDTASSPSYQPLISVEQKPNRTLLEDARQKVANLLTDHLQLKVEGNAADTQTVCDVLVKASVEGRAIEGTCNDLKDVPTGHKVRTYLIPAYAGTNSSQPTFWTSKNRSMPP